MAEGEINCIQLSNDLLATREGVCFKWLQRIAATIGTWLEEVWPKGVTVRARLTLWRSGTA